MKKSTLTRSGAMLMLITLAHSSNADLTGNSDAEIYTYYLGYKQVGGYSWTRSNSPADYIIASHIGLEPCVGVNTPWDCQGLLDPVAIPPSGQAYKDYSILSPWIWEGDDGCIQGWHGMFLRDEQDWLVVPDGGDCA